MICKKCQIDKPLTDECFRPEKRNKLGFSGSCKECENKHRRKWQKEYNKLKSTKERRKKINRKCYLKYVDERREDARKRMSTPEAKERARIRMREHRKDPVKRIAMNVSRTVRKVLRGQQKKSRTFDYLPYTPEELKEYIESQFDSRMSWDNYGSYWEVDHIYPQCRLPYDNLDHPSFQRCWALSNLRPLPVTKNREKSASILIFS